MTSHSPQAEAAYRDEHWSPVGGGWKINPRTAFDAGVAWQRSQLDEATPAQPVDVTEAMVEAAVRAWEGEGYPKHMGTMLQVALRAALGVVEPKPAPETPELPTTERQS